jgi:AcrR family transcriptional regulator
MLTVEADADRVEQRLRSGGLFCPFCEGVLVGWGFARPRVLRGVDGLVRVRPRRAACTGCGRTQVLLPVIALSRRADVVEAIGVGLVAKAAGVGHRRIAVLVGRPAATVRGWLRRFAGRAEVVRAAFTALAVAVDPGTAPPVAAGSTFGDAVAAVLAATAAVIRRWPALRLAVSPWSVAAAVSHGGLLGPAVGLELTNTNRLWAGLW